MGFAISKFLSNIFSKNKPTFKILMLGLEDAGKTTILLKLNPNINYITYGIGFNMETIENNQISIDLWDIDSQIKTKFLWKTYYQYVSAVIFVLDSTDQIRFDIAKQFLYQILNDQETKQIPILIYANKQDISIISQQQISEQLGLSDLKNRKYQLQGCCALTGEGIFDGLDWLNNQLNK